MKDDDIIDHNTHSGLHYFDSNRLASGRQGSEYGRCFWRFQPDRFRFQRRGHFFGKNDSGSSHYFHADIHHIDLLGVKKDLGLDGWGIRSCNETDRSCSAKTGSAAWRARPGEYSGGSAASEVTVVLFRSANRFAGFLKTFSGHELFISCLFAAEVVELVDTLS